MDWEEAFRETKREDRRRKQKGKEEAKRREKEKKEAQKRVEEVKLQVKKVFKAFVKSCPGIWRTSGFFPGEILEDSDGFPYFSAHECVSYGWETHISITICLVYSWSSEEDKRNGDYILVEWGRSDSEGYSCGGDNSEKILVKDFTQEKLAKVLLKIG
jgi:hypothetical protein